MTKAETRIREIFAAVIDRKKKQEKSFEKWPLFKVDELRYLCANIDQFSQCVDGLRIRSVANKLDFTILAEGKKYTWTALHQIKWRVIIAKENEK